MISVLHFVYQVTCPKLPKPDYGDVIVTGLYPKDNATYSCNPGYILDGPKVRTCRHDGTWKDKAPICKRKNHSRIYISQYIAFCTIAVDCGPLPDIPYGKVSVKPYTKLGSIAKYSCDDKYKLVGDDKRVCQPNGNWSGKEPKCVYVPPPKPQYPDHHKCKSTNIFSIYNFKHTHRQKSSMSQASSYSLWLCGS